MLLLTNVQITPGLKINLYKNEFIILRINLIKNNFKFVLF